MAVVDPAAEQPMFVIQGVRPAGDSLLDAIRAFHTQSLLGLQSAAPTPPDIDWSMLFEPSDASDCPSVITLKAVGLPEYGDHACNLLLIG